MSGLLDTVRGACERVAGLSRSVRIDEEGLRRWVDAMRELPPVAGGDPAHRPLEDSDAALAYVVTLDAINFGSGWFPQLHKRPGLSGYFTIATCLKEQFARAGAWSAAALRGLDGEDCARVFEQAGNRDVRELMDLFARALRDLGAWLEEGYGGSFAAAIGAADGSAERLAESLAEMHLYRDVAHYAGFEVPFYKRAQITSADLAQAFAGHGPGRFHDLDRLTIFADNLVPHVLCREGVLVYAPDLAARIEREDLVAPGSPEEVEIRATALHAVERIAHGLRDRGIDATAQRLDYLLWTRGQRPEMKAHPRHRTRCAFY